MTSILTEQPTMIFVIGALAVVLSLVGLVKSGRAEFLYGTGALVLLTAVALIAERQIVTKKEELRGVLLAISDDLAADDIPAVLNYFSSEAEDIRKRAEGLLKRVRVTRVAIKNNLQVAPKDGRDDCVVATFNAVGIASERKGSITDQPSPQFMTVEFVHEGGSWRIRDYSRQPPQRGLR